MQLLSETTHLVKGLDPVADAFSGTVRSDVVNMKNFSKCRFIIHCGVGATGTSTITVNACDDTTPSNRTAVPFRYREILSGDTPGTLTDAAAAGFTTTAGSSKIIIVEVDASELADTGSNDRKYVELNMVESVDSPVLGGILVELYGARFAEDVMATAIT